MKLSDQTDDVDGNLYFILSLRDFHVCQIMEEIL